jgi:hypothetical protein
MRQAWNTELEMTPEPHEPPDLRDLDESDQYREVYAWTGLALYYAQVFE